MRIVLLPVLLGRTEIGAREPTLGLSAAGIKKDRVCGLDLAAPGPPGVG
jgi:hypothetical protein